MNKKITARRFIAMGIIKIKRESIKLLTAFISFMIFSVLIGNYLQAQSKKTQLERQKKKLEEEIRYNNVLLNQTKKDKELSLNQVIILNNQISKREELIGTYRQEIELLNTQISDKSGEVKSLSQEVEQIKKEYAKLIVFAYKNRSSYNRLMYILAARDFNQAYKRMKYLQQYNEYRKKQAEALLSKQTELGNHINELKAQKSEKDKILASLNNEINHLENEKTRKNKSLESLKKREKQILASIKEKQLESQKLKKLIEKLITEEMSKKTSGSGSKKYNLTPAETTLSKTFSKNKGKLPWPTEKGIVTSTYGVHPHPILSGVKTQNNGINIATESGAKARALFDGEVKSIVSLPGIRNNAILIKHGEYWTVYSNIDKVLVKEGENVKTKQAIGIVNSDSKENKTELHLEIWYNKATVNPIDWLAKMY